MKKEKTKKTCTYIGGQAVMEGVMMRGKRAMATAVRDPQGKIQIEYNPKDTLYDLTQKILKGLDYYPSKDTAQEIRTIGSSILSISKAIERLRSEKTKFHGKDSSQYIIDDPLYASFIVNCVATLGNFLITYYESKYQILNEKETQNSSAEYDFNDLISEDEIPF